MKRRTSFLIKSWIAMSTALLLASAPSLAASESIVLKSGDNTVADSAGRLRDQGSACTHKTTYPGGDWVTEDAFVVPTYTGAWDLIPGTSWISWYPGSGSPGMTYGDYDNNYAAYERSFDLPQWIANGSMELQYMADDWTDVYLNGNKIVDQHSFIMKLFQGIPLPSEFCTFTCISTVVIDDPSLFLPGQRNTLRFVQWEPDGIGGIDYQAAITYDTFNPPPVARCQDVTVHAGPNGLADASVDNGSYDPQGDPITLTQSPVGPYPRGTTAVTLTVTETQGLSSSCTDNVTVVDIVLKSGDNTVTDSEGRLRDQGSACTHKTTYPGGDWVTEDAFVVPTLTGAWALIPGTSWISWYPDAGSPGMTYDDYANNYASYETSFDLPLWIANGSMELQYMADDWTDVYLNGNKIVDQHSFIMDLFQGIPLPPEFCTFTCISTVVIDDPSLFLPGQRNTLRFVQWEPDGTGGLDYQAAITYDKVNLPPVARCQNVTVPAGPAGTANASVDNGSYDPQGNPVVLTQSPAGPYPLGTTAVTLTATETQGLSSTCTGNVIVVDQTPPVTTAGLNGTAGENGWYITNVTVALSATDGTGSGVALTQYSYNGTTWTTYSTPLSLTTAGTTTVFYKSRDTAGNWETAKTVAVKIDKTAPTVSKTSPVKGAKKVALKPTITVTFSETIAGGANYAGITLKKSGSSTAVATTNSIAGAVLTMVPNANLAGATTYVVTIPAGGVKDLAGLPMAALYSFSFITK